MGGLVLNHEQDDLRQLRICLECSHCNRRCFGVDEARDKNQLAQPATKYGYTVKGWSCGFAEKATFACVALIIVATVQCVQRFTSVEAGYLCGISRWCEPDGQRRSPPPSYGGVIRLPVDSVGHLRPASQVCWKGDICIATPRHATKFGGSMIQA